MSHVAAFAKRSFFYVGGQYENATQYGHSDGMIMKGQIYVESLEPLEITKKWPIVMIEGAAQTGSNFLNTPDGRPGWADYYLNQGHHVYIMDQPGRGRSGWFDNANFSQTFAIPTTDFCIKYWTAPKQFGIWEQSKHHTQWPGSGLPGNPIFDAFYASQVQYLSSPEVSEKLIQSAGLALLEKIGPAIILTHSQSGSYGWGIADLAQPKGLVKSIIALEPSGPPFVGAIRFKTADVKRPYGITTIPITYDPPLSSPSDLITITSQPPENSNGALTSCVRQDPTQPGGPRQLPHLHGFPVLVVTSHASYHAAYDYCTVEYLRDAGVNVSWLNLPESGILGNGHFMFMEKNSDEIAGKIEAWIEESVKN